ncbi:20229_t:CDS:1, partial [Racocetra persica]
SDIITAAHNLASTCLANIELNRNQEKNKNLVAENKEKKSRIDTIIGISKYNCWQWPIAGSLARYIVACPLSHFRTPVYLSLTTITSLCNKELYHPKPKVSIYTEPQSKWTIALPKPQDKKK